MRVIGTAGHVDHGKSTLVQALTGIHPDRLKEEREREMTIDLGFAWMTLPNGEEAGIVDVPGHRDFIENMLAGVGGIDAALLVIAADEGIMPQTREHLAILDLLEIPEGVIVVTKTDLVDEPDWLDLMEDDICQSVRGTVFEKARVVRVSARQRTGLDELLDALVACLSRTPVRPDLGRPRLPVDRVFTISGFGTIVTGTLSGGVFKVGDEIEALPQLVRGRIRGLQTHKRKSSSAEPGSRTAINISGVDVEQLSRGDVITHPGTFRPTQRIDAQFRLLSDVSSPLRHDTEVKFFIGACERVGRVRLLGSDQLEPGQSGWLQIEIRQPVIAERGDRFILRRPSPGETIGGGSVIDPHPPGRHKRSSEIVMSRLNSLSRGTPEELLYQEILAKGIAPIRTVIDSISLTTDQLQLALQKLHSAGKIEVIDENVDLTKHSDALIAAKTTWENTKQGFSIKLERYHQQFPLRKGIPKEELKGQLKLQGRIFNVVYKHLASEGLFQDHDIFAALAGHQIQFTLSQQEQIDALLSKFEHSPFSPPSVKECREELGDALYQALIETGVLIQVAVEVVFREQDYRKMISELVEYLQSNHSITVAQMRDRFNTSRKYALGILEHLDTRGITMRNGDFRTLKKI